MLMLQFTCDLRVLHSAGPELWWSPTSEEGGGVGGSGEGKLVGCPQNVWCGHVAKTCFSPKFSFSLPYLRRK